MSVKTPLLHDDELDSTSGLQGNKESISVKERSFTAEGDGSSKRHRRTCLVAPVVLTTTVVLLTVLLTLTLGLKSIADEVKWISHSEGEKSAASDARLEKYQTLADTLFCSDWTDTRNYSGSQLSISNASFSLPPETNLTFFLSRGSPSFGHFDLGVEGSLGGKIRVDVIAQYENTEKGRAELLARSKACFAGQKNEQGIMLWSDPEATLSRAIFNISVHLPKVREIHDISTDFTNGVFSHLIKDSLDIWDNTDLGVVRLNARNARMDVSAFYAQSVFVQTSNADIKSAFWFFGSASVQTSNAALSTGIWALGLHDGAEISFSVRNSNGPVTAALFLGSGDSRATLNASIHTSNGNLSVVSPHLGFERDKAILFLDASTSNAPAFLELPVEYEGGFDLETTSGSALVDYNPDDRNSKGEKRVFDMYKAHQKSHKAGSVYWGDKPPQEDQGDIRLRSTKENVIIKASKLGY